MWKIITMPEFIGYSISIFCLGLGIGYLLASKKLKNTVNITMPIYELDGALLETLEKQQIVEKELK